MAAGLGFKDFTTGEVLTANDVDGYLMQGIWVFASAAARDAAVTSPQEGNFAYLKDTNVTTYYTGSAWTNLDTTGMVNPMTTTGDTIYSSSGTTPARLGIGSTGQVLTVAAGLPSWATPAFGKVLQVVSATKSDTFTTTSTSFVDVTGFSASITPTLATSKILVFYNLSGMQSDGALSHSRLLRGATAINIGDAASARNRSTSDLLSNTSSGVGTTSSGSYLDSPATTSSTTYKMQVCTSGGTTYVNRSATDSDVFNRSRTVSTITLMEIGA